MNERKWTYHLPCFESDQYNKEMMIYSPWSGHRNFAYDYVCFKKPQTIVELGSYYGCSAFTFLQAIKDQSLDSKFYGIDTWQGDRFTKQDYREDVYTQYKKIQDTCFQHQNAKMLSMTFDQAVKIFDDHSIDLLHIDGSHTYEDVKHDFLLWKDKVKEDGIIFFHDIGKDKLLGEVMGSHMFWEEVKQECAHTIEFPFSFGLGLLFFSATEYQEIIACIDLFAYQRLVNDTDAQNKDMLRKHYFEKRELNKYNEFLKEQIHIQWEQLKQYQIDAGEKDQYIARIEREQNDLQKKYQAHEAEIEQLANAANVTAYEKTITEKDCYIDELEKRRKADIEGKDGYIAELQQVISAYQADILKKDEYSTELQQTISLYQADSEGKEEYINELKQTVSVYQADSEGKDEYINELKQMILVYQADSEGKEEYINELKQTILLFQADSEGKEEYINELKQTISAYHANISEKDEYIAALQETIISYQKDMAGKDAYIIELGVTIERYQSDITGKETYIKELLSDIEKYNETFQGKDQYINELELSIKSLNEQLMAGQRLLAEGEARIAQQQEQIAGMQRSILILETAFGKIPFGRYLYQRLEKKNEGNQNA